MHWQHHICLCLHGECGMWLKSLASCVALQDDYFQKSDIKACDKKDLPKLPDCHEWTTKKRKQQHQHPQQPHGHPHPHGPNLGPPPPGYGHPHPGTITVRTSTRHTYVVL